MVRVVAGTARGRRLEVPEGDGVRPTSDRVREAVFNSLHSLGAVVGARVLDLFAGSGALGIEALSRGAARATFVEHDPEAADVLARNLARLGLAERAELVTGDVFACLGQLAADRAADRAEDRAADRAAGRAAGRAEGRAAGDFDVVLCDPPYSFDDWQTLLGLCGDAGAASGIVVIESDRQIELPAGFKSRRSRRYGATVVTFASVPDAGS